MPEDDILTLEQLTPILGEVVRDNREKVLGWIRDESGCWGYLSGKAVTATRDRLGRPLNDEERIDGKPGLPPRGEAEPNPQLTNGMPGFFSLLSEAVTALDQ